MNYVVKSDVLFNPTGLPPEKESSFILDWKIRKGLVGSTSAPSMIRINTIAPKLFQF